MTVEEVITVARRVRREILAEMKAGRHRYFNHRTLRGACTLASVRVAMHFGAPGILRLGRFYRVRRRAGLEYFFEGSGHYWLEIKGTIVDATATQFGWNHAVAVVPPGDLRRRHYWIDRRGRQALIEAVHDVGKYERPMVLWWVKNLGVRA